MTKNKPGQLATIAIDINENQVIREAFELYGQAAHLAMARALKKYARSISYQLRKQLAMALGVPQKSLRPRVKFYSRHSGKGSAPVFKIWAGLYPIAFHKLGNPRQLRKKGGGVKVKKHFREKAYIMPKSGKQIVFERVDGKLKLVRLEIAKMTEKVMAKLPQQIAVSDKFMKLFKHEMDYILRDA
jgi:hypothetical protein